MKWVVTSMKLQPTIRRRGGGGRPARRLENRLAGKRLLAVCLLELNTTGSQFGDPPPKETAKDRFFLTQNLSWTAFSDSFFWQIFAPPKLKKTSLSSWRINKTRRWGGNPAGWAGLIPETEENEPKCWVSVLNFRAKCFIEFLPHSITPFLGRTLGYAQWPLQGGVGPNFSRTHPKGWVIQVTQGAGRNTNIAEMVLVGPGGESSPPRPTPPPPSILNPPMPAIETHQIPGNSSTSAIAVYAYHFLRFD